MCSRRASTPTATAQPAPIAAAAALSPNEVGCLPCWC